MYRSCGAADRHRFGEAPEMTATRSTSVHVRYGSYFLWHTCAYCSQIDINMERLTWSKLANIHLAHSAAYGNVREESRFITSVFRAVCVQIIVRLLLSTVTYGKLAYSQ